MLFAEDKEDLFIYVFGGVFCMAAAAAKAWSWRPLSPLSSTGLASAQGLAGELKRKSCHTDMQAEESSLMCLLIQFLLSFSIGAIEAKWFQEWSPEPGSFPNASSLPWLCDLDVRLL